MSGLRRIRLSAALAICIVPPFAATASADTTVGVTATTLRSRDRVTVYIGGDPAARRFAIVLAPASTAPHEHFKSARAIPPTSTWPVRPPLRVIGWVSFQHNRHPHFTTIRLPTVMPGKYKLFALWKTPHPAHQPYLLYPASRYRGGGLIEDATINGVMLTIGAART